MSQEVEEPRPRGVDIQLVCITSPTAELLNLVLSEADLGSRRCHAAVEGVARKFRGVDAGFCQQCADTGDENGVLEGATICVTEEWGIQKPGSRKNIEWITLTAQAGVSTAAMYV